MPPEDSMVALISCVGLSSNGGPRAAQRSEKVKPAALEVVFGESLGQGCIGEIRRSKQPAEEPERRHVQIGPFSAPLGKDVVDLIWRLRGHDP